MLPLLAVVNLFCAWQMRRLAGPTVPTIHDKAMDVAPDLAATSPRSGLRVLAGAPYLRNLAALVLLGTVGAALADYVFKAQAVQTFGRGDALLQFFALYYAGVSLLAFVVQTTSAPLALERLGLAVTTARRRWRWPSAVWALVFPGLGWRDGRARGRIDRSAVRCSGRATRSSSRRSRPHEKRAAKSIIDVGFDRLGDAVGGGLIQLLILLPARSNTWRDRAPPSHARRSPWRWRSG